MKTTKYDVITPEMKEAKIDGYASIKLSFGKYKGLSLDEIHSKDPKYLLWLKNTNKVDVQTSPTMKAILKYCRERV